MRIKTINISAQFVKIGETIDFQIEKDIAGKCNVIDVNKETNEITLELDEKSSINIESFMKENGSCSTMSIE